jgi:precorrin-2 dehydrogenase / sirohydrochlorin ferrochelatase
MLPVALNLKRIRVLLVGEGAAARRRLALLDEADPGEIEIYAPDPEPRLARAAGSRLRLRWPEAEDIARAQLVFLAVVPEPIATRFDRIASAAGVLLNIEDDRARSDFHSSSVLRRGDLTIAISTNGNSPGLAAALRRLLEAQFGPEWRGRLDRMAALRADWQKAGIDSATIACWTTAWLSGVIRNPRHLCEAPGRPLLHEPGWKG